MKAKLQWFILMTFLFTRGVIEMFGTSDITDKIVKNLIKR